MHASAIKLESAKSRLSEAADKFRLWASEECPVAGRTGEWELDYDGWNAIYEACTDLLAVIRPGEWDPATAHQFLYLLARDNEIEHLKRNLVRRQEHLFALVEVARTYDDPYARWQIADALGAVEAPDETVIPLLEPFVHDRDEYASRRALLAMAQRKSSVIEPLAVRAWETGEEYQRIAALDVLATKTSPLLASYLAKAQEDGREYVVLYATKLREEGARP